MASVFDAQYELPSLEELDTYVKSAHHLPGVPSAAVVEKEGLDLGEMQKIQMQKIEELTLYMIAMKAENDLLKKRMAELEKIISHHSKP